MKTRRRRRASEAPKVSLADESTLQKRLPTPTPQIDAGAVAHDASESVSTVAPSQANKLARKLLVMAPTLATSFILFAILVVQAVILARTLEPEGRGEYAAVISYTRILTYIGLFGINYAIVRRAARAGRALSGLSRSALLAGFLTGLVTMAVVVLLSFYALPAGKAHLALFCVVCASTLPFEQMRLNLVAVDQGSGKFARFNVGKLVATAAMPVLLVVYCAMGKMSVAMATYLLVPATLIGLGFRLAWRDREKDEQSVQPPVGTLLREGLPFALSQLAGDLFSRLDTVLILWLASTTAQGFYAASLPAVQILAVAPEALAVFAFNAGAKSGARRGLRAVLLISMALIAFQIVSAAVYSLLVGKLILLVYGGKFYNSIGMALALLPAVALQGCTIVADGYMRGRGRAGAGIHARLVAAPVMVAAAALLHPSFAALSVPMAASIGNGVSFLWIGWAVLNDLLHRTDALHSSTEAALL